MIQEFLIYLKDYNLFEQISLCLGLIAVVIFYLSFIVSIFVFISIKVAEFGFKYGCFISAISLFILVYSLIFLQTLTVFF